MDATARSQPTKKRRRWPAAIPVVTLVLLVSIYYWPPEDTRFVGTWAVPPKFTLTFRSDGSGVSRADWMTVAKWNWSVSGDRLVIHKGSIFDRLPLGFVRGVERIAGRKLGSSEVYEVISVSSDTLQMRFDTRTSSLSKMQEWKRVTR